MAKLILSAFLFLFSIGASAQNDTSMNRLTNSSYKSISTLETALMRDTLVLSIQQTLEIGIINDTFYRRVLT